MLRAAVFIGVDRAGDLPRLRDAAAGARRLYEDPLLQQQFAKRELITDEGGAKVTPDRIFDVIDALLRPRNLSQLLIYFAGHGVNRHQGEYWLLSDAPRRSSAAVNLRGSEHLARYYSRVPHVIFVSDCCRTSADGLQLQNLEGSEIFPALETPGDTSAVDLFYAASLGRPSHEIRDVNEAVRRFRAIYTDALQAALRCEAPGAIEWRSENGSDVAFVRPRALRNYLRTSVAERLVAAQLQDSVQQMPDAIISSEPDAWLARRDDVAAPALPEPPPRSGTRNGGDFEGMLRHESSSLPQAPSSARGTLDALVAMAIREPGTVADVLSVTPAAGPLKFESQCGFKLRGARVRVAYARGARLEQLGPARDIVRVNPHEVAPLVLFELDNGNGVVLPALPGFVGALKFDADELIDVSYEPSENSDRAQAYQRRARELRALRQVVAAASREGTFRLEREQAATFAKRLQLLKGVDPALAIYAAYAYQDLNETGRLADMQGNLQDDLGAVPFDVAMLSGALDRCSTADALPFPLLGAFPLLAQGWAYLRARRITLAGDGLALQSHLTDSLWTVFGPGGVQLLLTHFFDEAQPWQPG